REVPPNLRVSHAIAPPHGRKAMPTHEHPEEVEQFRLSHEPALLRNAERIDLGVYCGSCATTKVESRNAKEATPCLQAPQHKAPRGKYSLHGGLAYPDAPS